MDNSASLIPSLLSAYELVPPLELYPLPGQGLNNTIAGLRTGAGNLIWRSYTSTNYHDLAAIHYEHQLLAWLARAAPSFAIPVPLTTRRGEPLHQGPHGWSALEPHLPGAQLDPKQLDQVELMGEAMAELHSLLQAYPTTPRPGPAVFGALFRFLEPQFDAFSLSPGDAGLPATPANEALFGWWRAEAAQLQAFVDGPYRTLPWQMCHNDFSPSNVLVAQGRVRAVLDFEFATPAARALDVAMGLRMTMRYWENPTPWTALRRFCRGYTRRLPLTSAELQAIPWLIRLRSAISTLWWLGRTDIRRNPGRVPGCIANQQEFVQWLAKYEPQFVAVLMAAAAP